MEAFKSAEGWKQRVKVVVLKVVSPSCFLLREAPSPHMSSNGRDFLNLEAEIRNSMERWAVEPVNPLLPEIGSVVLVKKLKSREWHRGRVNKLFDTIDGYKVELRKLFHQRLLEVPFQCIAFSLPELRPVRWTIDKETIGTKYGLRVMVLGKKPHNIASQSWDTAAVQYVKSAIGKADSVQVQVLGTTSSGSLAGKLFIDCNKTTMCLNEELVKLNYAVWDVQEDSGEITLHEEEIRLRKGEYEQPLVKEPRVDSSAHQIYFDVQRNAATAALKDVHDDILELASQEYCIPVKVSWPEAEASPPRSVSASSASSPTQWSSASTSISIGAASTGSDTPPTLPGLGRGLASMLRLDEGRSPSPLQESSVEESTEDLVQESWRPVRGLTPDVASYSSTAIGTPHEDRGRRKTCGTAESVKSMALAPVTSSHVCRLGHPPVSCSVSECATSKPCVTGRSSSGEHKARGRARVTQPYFVFKAQFDASVKVRPPGTANPNSSEKVAVVGAAAEDDGTCVQSKTSEFCAPDTKIPGEADSSLYHSVGRGLAVVLLKQMSSRVFGQHASSLPLQPMNAQQNESVKLCKGADPSKRLPTCVDLSHTSSCTVSKAQRLKDLLQKQKSSLNGAPLQNTCSFKSQAGKDDASLAVQKPDWHLQFTSQQAPMNVSQGMEDLQFHEFQRCSEVQPDLDPSEHFRGPVDFITDYGSCSLTESVYSKVRVLCHGLRVPSAQEHLDKTIICDPLKSNLRSRGFRAPTPIQSVAWPAVESGRNVVAVGPPHSGKTLGYLVPLLSRILTESDYKLLPGGVGPLMVILASTWKGAQRIYEQIRLLTEETVGPRCTVLYAGGSEKEKEVQIVNGCDILVATPNSFLRYLENYNRQIVNLYRCCHLVLDDGERLLDNYAPEVAKVVNEYWKSQAYRCSDIRIEQIIVCSTMWTSGVDLFLRKLLIDKSPLVFFSSFFEAAIYAQVQTITHCAEPHMHHDILLGILQGNQHQRVVVCTSKRETAIAVNRLLSLASVYSLLLHDQLPMAKISEVSREWMGEHTRIQAPVLVAQDNVLCLAKIRDATVLVHYDVPTLSKSSFGFRYSCLASHMQSFRAKDNISPSAEGPVAHMILSRDNSKLSLQLVEFLTKCGSNVPCELMELATHEQTEMSTNAEVSLCPNLKAFGHCEQPAGGKRCSYRHSILPSVDHSPVWSDLPSEGHVRIVVTKVISASHFYAWILEEWNTPSGSSTVTKAEVKEHVELQETMLSLNEYLSQSKNCARLEEAVPAVGQVYALEVSVNRFQRVLVTSIVPGKSAPPYVTVNHIDYGDQSTVAATRLVQLPQRLARLRPFAVEVYCCRIQPQDRDISWTCQADLMAYNLYSRKELLGRVALRLGNTLWIDPLVMREKLPFVNAEVALGSVSATLIKEGLACTNENHIKSLHEMAANAGVSVPPLPAGRKGRSDTDCDDATVVSLCSSFLDSRDFNHVYLWKVISPSHFYVQTLKFNSCLDQLEDDIQKAVERQQVGKLRALHIGVGCLARYSNDRWYRGEVLKAHNDKAVDIFFPDYGDIETCSRDELLEPASWMMLLPYQGISCCLAGIGPQDEEWSPKAQSLLEDFGYDNSDINRVLCLRVARKSAGTHPGNNHYEVFLFDGCNEGRISIGDLLVEKGLAVQTQLPELDFDVDLPHVSSCQQSVPGPSSDSDDNDDDDPLISQCKKNLEEHVYKVFSDVRDQVLAPATAKLMEQLAFSSDMLERGPSQVQGVDEPSAQFHQLASKKTALERSTVKKQSPDCSLKDILTLESVFKEPSSHQAPVSWWQDDRFVYVDVLIANAKTYDFRVSATSLLGRVYTAELEYLVHEPLFAAILPKKARLVMKTQCLKVTLEKAQYKLYWEFLTGHHRKSSHIRYDLEHVVVSDDDEDDIISFCEAYKDPNPTGYERPKKILPYDPVAHVERLMETEAGEDEHSDSSDEMYSSSDPNNIFEGQEVE